MNDDLPRVTIGVPVYNPGPDLRACLQSISEITYPALEIIVSDNASTDETPEICAEFAERDPRFRIVRQSKTIPMEENFSFVLDEAEGSYFCWRAHDDLSEPNFVSDLADVLNAHPEAGLAAPSIRWTDTLLGKSKVRSAPDTRGMSRSRRTAIQLSRFSVHWFYGLYRTEYVRERWGDLVGQIGFATFHWDIIWVGRIVSEGAVVTIPDVLFHGRRLSEKDFPYEDLTQAQLDDAEHKAKSQFALALRQHQHPWYWRILLPSLTRRLVGKRIVSKNVRRAARQELGQPS